MIEEKILRLKFWTKNVTFFIRLVKHVFCHDDLKLLKIYHVIVIIVDRWQSFSNTRHRGWPSPYVAPPRWWSCWCRCQKWKTLLLDSKGSHQGPHFRCLTRWTPANWCAHHLCNQRAESFLNPPSFLLLSILVLSLINVEDLLIYYKNVTAQTFYVEPTYNPYRKYSNLLWKCCQVHFLYWF